MRYRLLASALALAAVVVACRGSHVAASRRVIVLGFDGLDYGVTRDLMARGKLPNFTRLAERGSFTALATSNPPQSPVAWSTFITGLDPGRHGIFDFVHRDPKTMTPYLSTTRTEPPSRMLTLGSWQIPLAGGKVELLRRGEPFWEVLERHGVETTIVRMPANFPPSKKASRELSGMGTPDLLGTYGTFSFFTSSPTASTDRSLSGGVVYRVDATNDVVHASLEGPENPFLTNRQHVTAKMSVYVGADRRHAKLVVGDEERLLTVGEWSDWVPITFDLAPTQHLHAEGRFYLRRIEPYFEMYVSPPNVDPLAPALPISFPEQYAAELAGATGRFYSQGMPEDTKGLKTAVLTPDEFLAQAKIAGDEVRAQYTYALDRFHDGFLFYYFGNVDQVSHMMWRARDPQHPAYDPTTDAKYEHVVDSLYAGLDAVVGDTIATLGPNDLLIVMSDHGFTSWRRSFNLNSWLRDNGYLMVDSARAAESTGPFAGVDWHRSRAYALGLNGLYVNLMGREMSGVVPPQERDALVAEISRKLLQTIDPSTGQPAISRMFRREDIFTLEGTEDIAPDLIVGYAKGTRGSDESALGELPAATLVDNRDAWSGDHCMDPAVVPGILLSSRPLHQTPAGLQELAAAILDEFGVSGFPAKR